MEGHDSFFIELTFKVRDDPILKFLGKIESIALELFFRTQKNLFCCVYGHPHMSIKTLNEDYLHKLLSLLHKENKFYTIMGDFNINPLK